MILWYSIIIKKIVPFFFGGTSGRKSVEPNRLQLFLGIIIRTNVNATLFRRDGSNLELLDNRFRAHLYKAYPYREVFRFLGQKVKGSALIQKTDEYRLSYFFLHVPKKYLAPEESSLLAIGPFCEARRSQEEVYSIMRETGIPERLFPDVSAFFDTVPVIENPASFEALIAQLASGLLGREYQPGQFPEDGFLPAESSFALRDNPQIARDSLAARYEAENAMLAAISAGNYTRAHELHRKFLSYQISPRADNPLRNQQHMAIIMNTLCRKAAEYGGVHPLYIDDLSTRFAHLINQIGTAADLDALTGEMLHKYCLLVKNHAMQGYSAVTKEIISYIDFHYADNLSLHFFAERFHLSRTYLSGLFRKETGVTLTDFIHQVRMRQAITLINSSVLPVTAIAAACGYNDVSYFIRIFKRFYGLSPRQYRKSILPHTHAEE